MKQVTGKVLFVIQPQSIVDVITNSSSELFVFNGNSKEIIEEMIRDVYPNYLSEYAELRCLRELDDESLENYLDWVYSDWNDRLYLSKYFEIPLEILYENWKEIETKDWWYGHLSREGLELIKAKLDLDNTFLLYSLDENPDWDMQEQLWTIGERYHLG